MQAANLAAKSEADAEAARLEAIKKHNEQAKREAELEAARLE